MKMILIIFQKRFFGENGPFWVRKWGILTILDRPQKFVVNFAQYKGPTGIYMKVIIMVCTKKIMFRTNGPFCDWKWHILITLDPLKEFFLNFAEWKRLIGTWTFYCFLRKNFIWSKFDLFRLEAIFYSLTGYGWNWTRLVLDP